MLEQANCLLWQADVCEVYPDEWHPAIFDPERGTSLAWDLAVVNQSQSEVPSWLPVAREQGETVSDAWLRSRDPEDLEVCHRRSGEAILSGADRYTQVFRNRMADGSIRWVHEDVRIEQVRPAPGTEVPTSPLPPLRRWRLTGVVTDITQQTKAERALAATRSHLRQVMGQANCLLWQAIVHEEYAEEAAHHTFDPVHGTKLVWHLQTINEAASEVAEDAEPPSAWLPFLREPGQTVSDAIAHSRLPDDNVAADRVAHEALRTGKPRYTQTFRNRMADGTIRWLYEDVRIDELCPPPVPVGGATPNQTPSGRRPLRSWRLTGVITDVTERKLAEEREHALAKELSQITERANCLLWRAEVTETYPAPEGSQPFDPERGTSVEWTNMEVVNEADVLRWLPIERRVGERFATSWDRARHPEDYQECRIRSRKALLYGADRYIQTLRTFVSGGAVRWLQEDVSIERLAEREAVGATGERLRRWRLIGVVTDVTERMLAEERQRLLAEDLRQVTERANCLLWRAEVHEIPPTDPEQPCTFIDEEAGTTLSWDIVLVNESEIPRWLPIERHDGESVTSAWYRSRHPDDQSHCDGVSLRCLASGADRYTQMFRNCMADGSVRWVQEDVRVEPLDAGPEIYNGRVLRRWRLTGVVTDVTERKAAEDALWRRANVDSLTGLPNRDWMRERIQEDTQQLSPPPSSGDTAETTPQSCLLVLDLDGFKYVNDSFGHDAGDRVLEAVAARLHGVLQNCPVTCLRDGSLARLGGDEFCVWIPRLCSDLVNATAPSQVSHQVPSRIAECLLQAISQPTLLELPGLKHREILMTGSVGVAVFPTDGADTETLFKNADTALYQAKEAGRGTYRFYHRERSVAVVNRLLLESRLRQAVRNEKLELWYQPQVDITTGELCGVETLLRWHDEELGLVPPSTFIPLAEEVGLIHALGEYALRQSCRQATRWRHTYHPALRTCVNLSALQVLEGGMIGIVLSALQETGLPGDALELEITETALFRGGEQATSGFFQELRAKGVRLAIDDFGTGYSSLLYLRRLPVDVVKIDRAFIADLMANQETRAIVRAIIELAHALGMTVTAEGVETEAQQAALAALGCNSAQGYLFSPPIPAAAMECLLLARSARKPVTV